MATQADRNYNYTVNRTTQQPGVQQTQRHGHNSHEKIVKVRKMSSPTARPPDRSSTLSFACVTAVSQCLRLGQEDQLIHFKIKQLTAFFGKKNFSSKTSSSKAVIGTFPSGPKSFTTRSSAVATQPVTDRASRARNVTKPLTSYMASHMFMSVHAGSDLFLLENKTH